MVILLPLLSSGLAFILHLIHTKHNISHWRYMVLNPLGICIFAYLSLIYLASYDVISFTLFEWATFGGLNIDIGVYLDDVSKPMLATVAVISALVHIFAMGYMSHSPKVYVFLSYISMFTFFMTLLVVASNFIQLFVGWEGVGFASFLLIGFYCNREEAGHCAVKAFMVNRVADAFFIIGIALVYINFNSFNFAAVNGIVELESSHAAVLMLICICLVIGAFGKSAQFGLHVWLPDAMIAPTPTSILLHAATMVAAGVFMLVRIGPMLSATPMLLNVVAYFGLMTAFFAGTVAICQNDIKKIVAYSTCSQLGYMVLAVGAGAYSTAMFHLATHAFFKALLFSAAGLIICYMDHRQDIRDMGNMGKVDPLLCVCMWIGTLALAGIPPFAGAVSKDAVLLSVLSNHDLFGAKFLFYGGVFCAFLTALYSCRLMFYVFHSRSSGYPTVILSRWDYVCMMIPISITTFFAIVGGFAFEGYFLHDAGEHEVSAFYEVITPVASGIGVLVAFFAFMLSKRSWAFLPLTNFFANRWYIDELYQAMFVRTFFRIGEAMTLVDKYVIDRILVLGWCDVFQRCFFEVDKLSSSLIRSYVAIFVSCICAIILLFGFLF